MKKILSGGIGTKRWVLELILPALALMVILCLDRLLTSVVITPFLASICMAIMALWFRPGVMALWVLIYACGVFLALFATGGLGLRVEEELTPLVRFGAFLVMAAVALGMSWQRELGRRSSDRSKYLMQSLTLPLMLSDGSGNIVFTNEAAAGILRCTVRELLNTSYFMLFSLPSEQGKFIAKYFEQFDGVDKHHNGKLRVCLQSRAGETWPVEWLAVQQGRRKLMLTMWVTSIPVDTEMDS
jgi:PAS domain-containing protein